MSLVAYDRQRVEELWERVRAAVADLRGVDSADPAVADTLRGVGLARMHLEDEWLPLLERIRESEAMTAPIGLRADGLGDGDGRSWFDDAVDVVSDGVGGADADRPSPVTRDVIASVVAGLTVEERDFFQGFVDAAAPTVASELSHYDDFPEYYGIDSFPPELARLDDRREWDRLAHLYLIETFHNMVDAGEVTLQRSGEHYWIDPVDLVGGEGAVLEAELIIGMAIGAGGISRGRGLPPSVGRTATTPTPPGRDIVVPTRITGYTRHGLERVMNKDGVGVSLVAVRDAVKSPIRVVPQSNGRFRFVGRDATVVLSGQGRVVTAWPTSQSGWRGPR